APSALPVLPALEDELDAVAVRIEDVGRVVARIVVGAVGRWPVVPGAGREGCPIGSLHLLVRRREEADMHRGAVDAPLAQPEGYPAVLAEALEVGMARRTVL